MQLETLPLTTGSKPISAADRGMFGFASAYPLSPELEGRRFQALPHHSNHLGLGESELKFNRLEGGAILPGHFNDPVQIFAGEGYQRGSEGERRR